MSDWLQRRRGGLTSTDCAAVLGLLGPNARKTPTTVWAEKRAPDEPLPEEEDLWLFRRGHAMEAVAPRELSAATGREVLRPREMADVGWHEDERRQFEIVLHDDGPRAIYAHPEYPWLLSTPDLFMKTWTPITEDGDVQREGVGACEVKSRQEWDAPNWVAGEIDRATRCQLQQTMLVTGVSWGSYLGLFWNHDPVVIDEPALASFHEYMLNELGHFWEHNVLKDIPPEADESKASLKALDHALGIAKKETIVLPAEAWGLHRDLEALAELKKRHGTIMRGLEEAERHAKQELTVLSDGAEILELPEPEDFDDSEGEYQPVRYKRSTVQVREKVTGAYSYTKLARFRPREKKEG